MIRNVLAATGLACLTMAAVLLVGTVLLEALT